MVHTLLCFGEILWDLLPSGKVAGGAPMNVAFHANNFGLGSRMISRIGNDALGQELRAFLASKGVDTTLVQTDELFPTGIVNVTLDPRGSPSYEIVQPVAWDYIASDPAMLDAAREADALVFGSLACRHERSKSTLLELLDAARLRVFDVNLRAPFFAEPLLDELLRRADIVKMNDEELPVIAGWYGEHRDEETQMHFLREKYGLDQLIVTRGRHGARCLTAAGLFAQDGFRATVKDTIGSGDSFLAAYLFRMFAGDAPPDRLAFACATGALVAEHAGGTPVINEALVRKFMEDRRQPDPAAKRF